MLTLFPGEPAEGSLQSEGAFQARPPNPVITEPLLLWRTRLATAGGWLKTILRPVPADSPPETPYNCVVYKSNDKN